MSEQSQSPLRRALEAVTVFTPWVISMFVLYWLEYGEIWTTKTPHRGKAAVTILIVGMGISFLVHSYFARRNKL